LTILGDQNLASVPEKPLPEALTLDTRAMPASMKVCEKSTQHVCLFANASPSTGCGQLVLQLSRYAVTEKSPMATSHRTGESLNLPPAPDSRVV